MKDDVLSNEHPIVRAYLKTVLAWHGYNRFLGRPDIQHSPDVPLETLYIPQRLIDVNTPADKVSDLEQSFSPVSLFFQHQHFMVQGEPGSGKTTLINWFAWQLSSRFSGRMPDLLSQLVPIPIVLNELELSGVSTFDGFIDAYLKRPVAEAWGGHKELLMNFFSSGKVLLLLDGADELTDDTLSALAKVLQSFYGDYKSCFSIVTGRIDVAVPSFRLAPLWDMYVTEFASRWFGDGAAGQSALRDSFIAALFYDDAYIKLARRPQHLMMMAQAFNGRQRLPHDSAHLYECTVDSYFESVDSASQETKNPIYWKRKKEWLAKVAFEMQLLRLATNKDQNTASPVPKAQVIAWIAEAMPEQHASHSTDYADTYFHRIARRNGLLVPRGNDCYAFVHGSYQEYLAAFYIQQQIGNPEYFNPSDDCETLDDRFINKPLKQWYEDPAFKNVFSFLFELMAMKPGWTNWLRRELLLEDSSGKSHD